MNKCQKCDGSGVDYWGKGCVTCGGRGRVQPQWPESYNAAGLCLQCGRCAGCHRGPNETSCEFAALVTCATGSCPPQYASIPDAMDRLADGQPIHYFDCERFNVTDYGTRQGKCDCTATDDLKAVLSSS